MREPLSTQTWLCRRVSSGVARCESDVPASVHLCGLKMENTKTTQRIVNELEPQTFAQTTFSAPISLHFYIPLGS